VIVDRHSISWIAIKKSPSNNWQRLGIGFTMARFPPELVGLELFLSIVGHIDY
jgi:hypothetical protein